MLAQEIGGGDPSLREARTVNLCPPRVACNLLSYAKNALVLLVSVYATIAIVLMIMEVNLFLPDIRDAQAKQRTLVNSLVDSVKATKTATEEMSFATLDTNLKVNLLAVRYNQQIIPLLQDLRDTNVRQINATMGLIHMLLNGVY